MSAGAATASFLGSIQNPGEENEDEGGNRSLKRRIHREATTKQQSDQAKSLSKPNHTILRRSILKWDFI